MSLFKDLTRRLLAAGASTSEDGKTTNFIYESDNGLCIRPWTGSEYADKTWIAAGVRSGTSAPVVTIDNSKRLVFCVDETNVLKCYAERQKKKKGGDDDDEEEEEEEEEEENEDDEEELWIDVSSSLGNIKVHPQTQVAAQLGETSITAFYQEPDGSLSSIVNKGRVWEVVKLPGAEAVPGTPLFSSISDGEPRLFYVGNDNSVHLLTKDEKQDNLTDAVFSNAKFDSPVSRLIVIKADDGFAVFVLTGGKLGVVKQASDAIEFFGDIVDGEFRATKGQERVLKLRGYDPDDRPIFKFSDGKGKSYFWTPEYYY